MPVPSDANQVLEEIIDGSSLELLLDRIADICHEKAEHLRAAWGDPLSAKTWDRDAVKIQKLASKLEN